MKRARCAMASERVFIPSLIQRARDPSCGRYVVCAHRGTRVYIYVHAIIYIYIYIYIYTCIYIYVYMYAKREHTYIYIYIYIYA
jgi:hypothetical protein